METAATDRIVAIDQDIIVARRCSILVSGSGRSRWGSAFGSFFVWSRAALVAVSSPTAQPNAAAIASACAENGSAASSPLGQRKGGDGHAPEPSIDTPG